MFVHVNGGFCSKDLSFWRLDGDPVDIDTVSTAQETHGTGCVFVIVCGMMSLQVRIIDKAVHGAPVSPESEMCKIMNGRMDMDCPIFRCSPLRTYILVS